MNEQQEQGWIELLFEEIDIGGLVIAPVYLFLTILGMVTAIFTVLKR